MFFRRAEIRKASAASSKKTGGAKRWAIALTVAAMGLGTVSARAADFFDWLGETTAPVSPPYVTAPTLNDADAAGVNAFLTAQAALGQPLAVKVRHGTVLSAATVNTIFNAPGRPIKYIFADYEGPTALTNVQTLKTQLGGTVTGNTLAAGTSFLGNYGYAPIPGDPTAPAGSTYISGNSTVNNINNITDFRNSGVNMSTEALYPGDASFRNPVNGNSTAPNIRSALFTLPIQRLSIASQNMGVGQLHIPYISRFNNHSNPGFQNSTALVNGVNLPAYNTALGGAVNAGQLLSRNDFQALVLHYRMRGADSYHLLDPGVVGYTQAQEESDALTGWTNSLVAPILSTNNGRSTPAATSINVDGTLKSIENAGVVYSGVTNDNVGSPGLAILVSNLDASAHSVTFNTRINGAQLAFTTGSLAAGSHTILRFTKAGNSWGSPLTDPSFNDPNLASRDGIGIPEPASVSLLAIGALGVLMRRRRRA